MQNGGLQAADLCHEEACFSVQQLALGPRVEQEGVTAEGEGAIQAKLVLGLVMCLPPCHVVVLHIQLLTATAFVLPGEAMKGHAIHSDVHAT